ncbi:MAG TPA: hypothetical protein VGG45_10785 [Terracidiphilus sp.]
MQNHPSVQRASLLHTIAQTLAGGPRYKTSINDDGTTTRTPVPLSRGDVAMAIVAEALSGSMAGLAQRGPGATGRAAAAGFDQVSQQQQQAQQQAAAQAQQDANNRSTALVRKATIFETNMRARLNAAQAEQFGADAIDKIVEQNRAAGLLDPDQPFVENGGIPMTQQELTDAIAKNQLSVTDHVGPIAGRIEVTAPDGSKYWETTHLILKSGDTKVPLTQSEWDMFAQHGVKGYPAGTKITDGVMVPLRLKALAGEQLAAHTLTEYQLSNLRDVLDGTPFADKVPAKVDWSQPGADTAMQRLQTYISHNAAAASDPYLALQAMGTDKRNEKTGQMEPNTDSKYVSSIANLLGGWPVLEAAHDQIAANKKAVADYAVIDTADKANAVIAAPKRFTQDQVQAAKNFITLSNEQGSRKAADDARARAIADGSDIQAMYRFGRNPISGEQLSLSNAPDSMLVNSSGQVIPQDLISTYKPTSQERMTADTARQVLSISADLQKQLQQNPNLAGPLAGRSKQGLAKLGYGDAQAQKFLDDVSFIQTAATKMHTSRFSSQILDKMSTLIKPGMNPDQFAGALSSINDIASRYADEDRLTTVGDYKQKSATPMSPNPSSGKQVQIPAGAQIGRDGQGNVVGYRLNGKYVSLAGSQ